VKKKIASEDKKKPILDEQALDKLLEAAFVLQEHNRAMQELELALELKCDEVEAQNRADSPSPGTPPESEKTAAADYTVTLAQIVETQHQIRVRHLELHAAMQLVAQRALEIAHGCGSAIAIADGKTVRYKAVAGEKTPPTDIDVPIETALCRPCLRTSQVFRCADINLEFLVDTEECRRRGIQSVISVPIFHDDSVAGGLELYYATPDAFTDQDVHTCQLMGGLVSEALAREEEATWKKSLADERAAMLQAIEKLQPNLAALINQNAAKQSASAETKQETLSPEPANPSLCRRCGREVAATEQFCGHCGLSRTAAYEAPSMQTKLASLWHMQEEKEKQKEVPHNGDLEPISSVSTSEAAPIRSGDGKESLPSLGEAASLTTAEDQSAGISSPTAREEQPSDAGPTTITHSPDWSSAASARDFLEHVAPTKGAGALVRFWNTRRGDIYLAIAVILVACVIRWGIWSHPSANANGSPNAAAAQHKPDPEAGLSVFERMLISLGLADPPEVPEDKGNPSTQVWVDLHTALYYCPGADLYGKTPTGKFATQREAQLDQFEPAYRKACN